MSIGDGLRRSSDRVPSQLVGPEPISGRAPSRGRWTGRTVVASLAVVGAVGITALILTGGDRVGEPDIGESPFGIWELVELDGQPPLGGASVTFAMEPDRAHIVNAADGSGYDYHLFTGSDGCNRFGGAYQLEGDHLNIVSKLRTLSSCGEQLNQEGKVFLSVLSSAKWDVVDDQLTMTGDDGTVALLREVATHSAMGVWVLSDLDEVAPSTAASLTFGTDNRLSGYGGCWVSGDYEADGGTVSVAAVAPIPELEPFPPALRCDDSIGSVEMFLQLVENAHGEVTGDLMILEGPDGLLATFVRGRKNRSLA